MVHMNVTKIFLTTLMVSELATDIVVRTEANDVSDQTRTSATGRKQKRGAGDEVKVMTEMIVNRSSIDGAAVHKMTNHVMMLVTGKMMPVMTHDIAETSLMMTEDLDMPLMINMYL